MQRVSRWDLSYVFSLLTFGQLLQHLSSCVYLCGLRLRNGHAKYCRLSLIGELVLAFLDCPLLSLPPSFPGPSRRLPAALELCDFLGDPPAPSAWPDPEALEAPEDPSVNGLDAAHRLSQFRIHSVS